MQHMCITSWRLELRAVAVKQNNFAISISNSMICSDISKLLYVISRAIRGVKLDLILKFHKWYLCQISHSNYAIICLYYYLPRVCNFYIQVFQIKLKYHRSKPIKLQKFLMQYYKILLFHLSIPAVLVFNSSSYITDYLGSPSPNS